MTRMRGKRKEPVPFSLKIKSKEPNVRDVRDLVGSWKARVD
jgi:hypothetical protein